ncbi:MAG: aminotransferase class III-fold pyridoxal phosphate-dependent enzyme [Acidobacteriota bacterium]
MTTATMGALSAEEIIELCKRHTLYEWSVQAAVKPIPVAGAKGVYFWEPSGKRYLDFNSQLMCVNIGHGDERVVEAIKRQAEILPYANPFMATEARARLGQVLAEITPGDLNKFFFTLGGAEANENAIKLARLYTGRHKIIARYRSYHGATAGAMTLTGDPRRWANEPGIAGVIRVFDPYRYRCNFCKHADACTLDCLNQIEEVMMYEGPQNIAAVFIETVTGTNGIIIPPDGYLQGLRQLCDKHGILLICDEVMSGFCRTGEWFAVDNWKVVPDLITMAKGLTSAYLPLGAVAMREQIGEYFQQRLFPGGLTYNSHPLSCAAAIATIDVYKQDNLIENTRNMGKVLARELARLAEKHPCIGETRSIGLFGIVELVRNRKTHEPMAPFNGTSPEMTRLAEFLRENGLYTFVRWNNFFTNPPLCINEQELMEGIEIIDRGLDITDQAVG